MWETFGLRTTRFLMNGCGRLERQRQPRLTVALAGLGFRLNKRSKVDGSLTSWLGGQSNRELSGAGWRADLYSSFGVQRNLWDLHSNKLEEYFSATGRRGRFVKIPAKRDDFGPLTSYFSDNKDLLAERGGFEPPIQLLTV